MEDASFPGPEMLGSVHLHAGVVEDDLCLRKRAGEFVGLLHLRIVDLEIEGQTETAEHREATPPIAFAAHAGTIEIGLHRIRVIVQRLPDAPEVVKGKMPFEN